MVINSLASSDCVCAGHVVDRKVAETERAPKRSGRERETITNAAEMREKIEKKKPEKRAACFAGENGFHLNSRSLSINNFIIAGAFLTPRCVTSSLLLLLTIITRYCENKNENIEAGARDFTTNPNHRRSDEFLHLISRTVAA